MDWLEPDMAKSPEWYDPTDLGIGHKSSAKTDLSLGDTDIEPPWQFREPEVLLRNATDQEGAPEDPHKYAAVAGRPGTREEIVNHWLHSDQFGDQIPVEQTPEGEPCLVVTPGGQAAVHHAINDALDIGEKALLLEPYYPYHAKSVRIFSDLESVVRVSTSASEGFQPPVSRIESVIDQEPIGALVLCSPSNPSGVCYDQDWLAELSDLARRADIDVVSDEVYAFLTHGSATHHSIASQPGMSERAYVIGSFSKVFGLSGWRLGFIRCPSESFDRLEDVTDSIAMQAATPAQVLLEHALRDGSLSRLEPVRERLEKRLDAIIKPFEESPKITVHRPAGGFYLLPAVETEYAADPMKLAGFEAARERLPEGVAVTAGDCLHSHLLDAADVEGTPGRCFGTPLTTRLAFGQTSVEQLETAAGRIRAALKRF